jgi:CRISPR-associated endonuclease/helicase Cas3
MEYLEFFKVATGGWWPFPFQVRFRFENSGKIILKAPTGLGKTDAVLSAWLHRRLLQAETTPRRLVWCLPGRALTEQLAKVAEDSVRRLVAARLIEPVRICRLLGGSADNDLTLAPNETAILIGTQDILLSRALNRGYARRPFRWPIDFALLNNDCQWVLDEVQLLGDGLATSTQLAAFRETLGCFGPAPACWISATFNPEWLRTVDFAPLATQIKVIAPDSEEIEAETMVRRRVRAVKRVKRAPVECRMPGGAAEFVAAQHRAGALSLVIANTVRRAVEIRAALEKRTTADVRLLHSRFRATERAAHAAAVLGKLPAEGRIVVATQVIEAGIDLDADLLVTDVAPYASLVQRFGRVNRYGDRDESRIFWVDRPLVSKRKGWAALDTLKPKAMEQVSAPYFLGEIEQALGILENLRSAAPADLPPVSAPPPWEHVLRRTDLLDLFDTSPDLGGNEIDISRFIRSGLERDVYVAWRDWRGEVPPDDMPEIEECELCPAPISDLKEAAGKRTWRWDARAGRWMRPEAVYPGLTLLMHASEGMYTPDLGWQAESKARVEPVAGEGPELESLADERRSLASSRQSLADHTEQVCDAMRALLDGLSEIGVEPYRAALEAAARGHDWGKAHPVMQQTLHNGPGPYREILAKQERSKAARAHSRRFFRHELASALAMLTAGEDDLAAYIAAAHHGRVRVVMRSMPGEREARRDFIRGIADGDELLTCSLGNRHLREVVKLSLATALLGRGEDGTASWTDRVLRLRDQLGPFRLAYLETLLRSADEIASGKAAKEAQ